MLTVKYDTLTNTNSINELSATDRFTIPTNLDIWTPPTGDVVTINKTTPATITCTLTKPVDNEMIFDLNELTLSADVTSASVINQVQFYVNGTLIDTDNTKPYETNWQPPSYGNYILSTVAQDENGMSSAMDFSVINIGPKTNIVQTSKIDIGSDECIEYVNKNSVSGYISFDESKIRICEPGVNLQMLRFKEINIPANAIVDSAYIQFNPKSGNNAASVTIWGEYNANSLSCISVPYNLSERQKTSNFIEWNNIPAWNITTPAANATTPNLKTLIQELIKQPGWTIESPITFLIGGTGKRNASSFMAKANGLVPTLTIEFSVPSIEIGCTDVSACNFDPLATQNDGSCLLPGMFCNDGNPETIEDELDEYCNCIGKIPGCNNLEACNFDPLATIDDGSCVLPLPSCEIVDTCAQYTVNNVRLNPNGTSVSIFWEKVPNVKYKLYYKVLGEPVYRTYITRIPFVLFYGLNDCTTYEFAVNLVCESGEQSPLSKPITYTTSECRGAKEDIRISDGKSLNIYPNPSNGNIEIQLAGGAKADFISIYNTTGQLVIDQNSINFDGYIYRTDVNVLPPGIYFVKTIKDNFTETKKIVVK